MGVCDREAAIPAVSLLRSRFSRRGIGLDGGISGGFG